MRITSSVEIEMFWTPPGKDCGACGASTCAVFLSLVKQGEKSLTDCPFYIASEPSTESPLDARYSGKDILGRGYDFILEPLPGEVSARKIILPFRPDLVETWDIRSGDIVLGRPMGAGCPVQHVLRVIEENPTTGVLTCFVVGPSYSRGCKVKDVEAYHMIGFEGRARVLEKEPILGMRQRFLPGYCMMNLCHTGIVNMVMRNPYGLHVRVEDIHL